MKLRLANINDLPQLKEMYKKIVAHMKANNMLIWDDVYPTEFLAEDIQHERLYVLTAQDRIVAALALNDTHCGKEAVQWENTQAKAMYIDRFGVNVEDLKRGIGSLMLQKVIQMVKEEADYLRLFVVDINIPAINLYKKNGFKQAEGVLEEKIEDERMLREYGFEIDLKEMIYD